MSRSVITKKSDQNGMIDHLALIVVFVVLFAGIGYYVFSQIFASSSTTPVLVSGLTTASGKWCMTDRGSGTGTSNPVGVSKCDGSPSQYWQITGSGNNLRVRFSSGQGYCIQPVAGGTSTNTQVALDGCDGHLSQWWTRDKMGAVNALESTNAVNTAHKAMCLAVPAGITTAQLALEPCAAYGDQHWSASTYQDNVAATCGASVYANESQAKCVAKVVMAESPYNMNPNGTDDGQTIYSCLVDLWTRESSWNRLADNPSSGAYGIAQALGHGDGDGGQYPPDYDSANPPTSSAIAQIEWGLGYIQSTYGPNGSYAGFTGPAGVSPCTAWHHETAYNWYGVDSTSTKTF